MNLSTKKVKALRDKTLEAQKDYIVRWRSQSAESKETIKDLAIRFQCAESWVKTLIKQLKDEKRI